jgi:hypothetical protein
VEEEEDIDGFVEEEDDDEDEAEGTREDGGKHVLTKERTIGHRMTGTVAIGNG